MTSHLAKEADRLRNDEIFNKALDDIRSDALEALAKADLDCKTMVMSLQQKVAVIDEIRDVLARYIIAADAPQEDAGSFA